MKIAAAIMTIMDRAGNNKSLITGASDMKKEPVMTHREYGRELKKAWAAHDQSSVDYLLDHFAVGNEGVFTIDHADRTDKKERANHRGNDSKSNKDAM